MKSMDQMLRMMERDDTKARQTSESCEERDREYVRQSEICMEEYELNDPDQYELVTIEAEDGVSLEGRLYRADSGNGVVLAMHGYHSGGLREMARFVPMYQRLGLDFLIISQRCHEGSGGTAITFGVREKGDCLYWCRFLASRYEGLPILLHGLSMGASTVLLAAGDASLPTSVRGVIADSPYTSIYDQTEHLMRDRAKPIRKLALAYLKRGAKRRYGFSLDTAAPIRTVRSIRIPTLFVHGTADRLVPFAMGEALYEACRAPHKKLLAVEGADHVRSYLREPERYEACVSTFLEESGFFQ